MQTSITPSTPPTPLARPSTRSLFRSLGDPFEEMTDLQNRMSSLLSRHIGNGSGWLLDQPSDTNWSPAVDVVEEDDCFRIQADLPDVKKEDIKITVANGMLTISGELTQEKEKKGRRYHRSERIWGAYSRAFQLPEGVDSDKADAQFKNGTLTLRLPKTENYQKQQREIKIHD